MRNWPILLTFLVNDSIKQGIVLDLFKVSCVIPIYKNGDSTNPSNYRPIAILPSLNKILERIVYDQLINFLNKHNIIHKHQFGFRKNHSTEQAILELTDTLKKSIDNKDLTCGIFLDFTKAFDTVDHKILLLKLYKYGIRGLGLSWFTNYLTDRKQHVRINNITSDLREIKYGVPQGSTLGPLLFLLYINDLPNSSGKLNFRMFADDSNIFYSHKDPMVMEDIVNTELDLVFNYCKVNKLTINFKKTHFIIFKSARKKIDKLNISHIDQKEHVKYLGVYIDQHLNWEQHIKVVHSKVSKNIGIIRKLRYYVNIKTLRDIYYSLIYPYLTYGILSWGRTYKTNLSRISTIQNKCMRNMFFAGKYEHAPPLYNFLNLLVFNNIFVFKAATFAYQIIHNKESIPIVFSNILKMADEQHSYNTRFASRGNIVRPRVKTNYGKFAFQFFISKIWEEIPTHIKKMSSYSLFRNYFKIYLMQSQI